MESRPAAWHSIPASFVGDKVVIIDTATIDPTPSIAGAGQDRTRTRARPPGQTHPRAAAPWNWRRQNIAAEAA
jgi:hypothetical protein